MGSHNTYSDERNKVGTHLDWAIQLHLLKAIWCYQWHIVLSNWTLSQQQFLIFYMSPTASRDFLKHPTLSIEHSCTTPYKNTLRAQFADRETCHKWDSKESDVTFPFCPYNFFSCQTPLQTDKQTSSQKNDNYMESVSVLSSTMQRGKAIDLKAEVFKNLSGGKNLSSLGKIYNSQIF